MRRALTTLAAPLFAGLMAVTIFAYPTPQELWSDIQPIEQDLLPVNGGGPNVEAVIRNIAVSSPASAASDTALDNQDCFQKLALADTAKLDRCARVVYQALIDMEKNASSPPVRQTLEATNSHERVVQQLRLAATEVCRVTWSKKAVGDAGLNSPACDASQVLLASDLR